MQKSKRTRIGTPYPVLWLNHIARYAQSLTAPNLTHCCDPDVNKFCATGSKSRFGNLQYRKEGRTVAVQPSRGYT